jgi:DNA-binding CsgD family transcriptional regulator
VEPSIVPPHFTLDSKQIELTPQELEVVIWTKLNLSTEEVALRMEVSPSHVYRLRGNLRKKIGIDRSQSLEAFLIAGELVPGGASA